MSAREHLTEAARLIDVGKQAVTEANRANNTGKSAAADELARIASDTWLQALAEGVISVASSLVTITTILENRLKK